MSYMDTHAQHMLIPVQEEYGIDVDDDRAYEIEQEYQIQRINNAFDDLDVETGVNYIMDCEAMDEFKEFINSNLLAEVIRAYISNDKIKTQSHYKDLQQAINDFVKNDECHYVDWYYENL